MRRFTGGMRVWQWMSVVALLATAFSASDLGGRWSSLRHRASSMSNGASRNRAKADFLIERLGTLRDRPAIRSFEGYYVYSGEWLAETRSGMFPMNDEDWTEALRRDDRENRAEAARLRTEAAMMDRFQIEFESRWW